MQLLCQLSGSQSWCTLGRGICCASCQRGATCAKACLNSPVRCGYAMQDVGPTTDTVELVPRFGKEEERNGGKKTAD